MGPGRVPEQPALTTPVPPRRRWRRWVWGLGVLGALVGMVYLLHPLSEYVNGQTIAIDGGGWNAGSRGYNRLADWTDEQWEQARAAIRGANEQDRAKRTV